MAGAPSTETVTGWSPRQTSDPRLCHSSEAEFFRNIKASINGPGIRPDQTKIIRQNHREWTRAAWLPSRGPVPTTPCQFIFLPWLWARSARYTSAVNRQGDAVKSRAFESRLGYRIILKRACLYGGSRDRRCPVPAGSGQHRDIRANLLARWLATSCRPRNRPRPDDPELSSGLLPDRYQPITIRELLNMTSGLPQIDKGAPQRRPTR
jgi:hypothetical protein